MRYGEYYRNAFFQIVKTRKYSQVISTSFKFLWLSLQPFSYEHLVDLDEFSYTPLHLKENC